MLPPQEQAQTFTQRTHCYKFILIFKCRLPKYNFIPSCCLYAALDYVINVRELLSRGNLGTCWQLRCELGCQKVEWHRIEGQHLVAVSFDVKNWFVQESDAESGNVAGASKGDANVPWFWLGGRTRLQLICCTRRQSWSFNFTRPLSQFTGVSEGEDGYDLSRYQNWGIVQEWGCFYTKGIMDE